MPTFSDPYTNPHLKRPNALQSLCDVLEHRAAEPQQCRIREQAFEEALQGMAGAVVLEVGCGTGAVARDISKMSNVANVVGVDPSPVFILKAKELAAGCSNISFREGIGTSLPVADDSVDLVVYWTVLIHVPPEEIPAMLLEAHRILKPGGRLLLADNDLAGWSCSTSKYDPLSSVLSWYVNENLALPWLARSFPQRLHSAGFTAGELGIHTVT
mmetsp:Transcript_32666/g.54012  ORF Transcript_32666/g.54012 Transcript_32666/m.54012 type:complete len:214 (+) Transcript_32666:115-756(+)